MERDNAFRVDPHFVALVVDEGGETIPYYTVFSLKRKTTIEQEAIDWAKEEIEEINRIQG